MAWEPLDVEEVSRLLAAAPFPWWISGATAIDLFLGRETRSHADLDVGVLRRDQCAPAPLQGEGAAPEGRCRLR
jgi:hypothetical protein